MPPTAFTAQEIDDLEAVLSPTRFGKYLQAVGGDRATAMQLYCWNADISAAFYLMLQFCELAVRNGAVEAIETEFGPDWHKNQGFLYTLPQARGGYQPRSDLQRTAKKQSSAGKTVAELKFAFWQYLFVKGQDARLWDPHFRRVFPGVDASLETRQARAEMFREIEEIRKLRNRIAHHEPIFRSDLSGAQKRIRRLIEWRRPGAATTIDGMEQVTSLLRAKPDL